MSRLTRFSCLLPGLFATTLPAGAIDGAARALPGLYEVRYAEPCNAARLRVVRGPSGLVEPPLDVVPSGASPTRLLRYDALEGAHLWVVGRLRSDPRADAACGREPELEVLAFAPAGPIRRVFCAECLDPALHVYHQDRPLDRFVPADYEAGPAATPLDAEACRPRPPGGCGEVGSTFLLQRDVSGAALCCPPAT